MLTAVESEAPPLDPPALEDAADDEPEGEPAPQALRVRSALAAAEATRTRRMDFMMMTFW